MRGTGRSSGNAMRHILHADFDAFYASVEQLDNPELRGRPVVVGGSADSRGVVAACSYEARAFGVRSAMPMRTALQRCPHAVRVPARFDRYHEVSRTVMAIFSEITPLVQPMSLDEAFLDVTDVVSDGRGPGIIGAELRREVKDTLGLTISVGVATSRSVAKIASDFDKPDGLTIVPAGTEQDFLAPLPASRLWGIGPKTARRLESEGVRTIGDLAARPRSWFDAQFGKTGVRIRDLAFGRDDSPVSVEREVKSISSETTLAEDTGDADRLFSIIDDLSTRVAESLEQNGIPGHTVKLKLRLSDFTTFTRQRTLPEAVASADELGRVARSLLETELGEDRQFRLLGVGVSGFVSESEEASDDDEQPRLL